MVETRKSKILIVDDDISICKALKRPLTLDGYFVDILTAPKEVLNIHNTQKYDIIFMDTEMPLPIGYKICAELRKQDSVVTIIGMSSEREYEKQWMDAGATQFYHKDAITMQKDVKKILQQYVD